MLRTLIYLTTYALSLLHAKPVTNHPTTRQGCEHEGQFYSPGERFDEGNNGQGWCYGSYCGHDGFVVAWDNFDCTSRLTTPKIITPEPTTPKTTRPETTTPKSTTPLTTFSPPTTTPRPLGCEFEGQLYSPGERFGEGNDGQGWCYGSYCTEDGSIVVWDNFNCHSTTSSMPDTTTYFTTRKITTPSNTTSKNTILPTTLLLSTVFSFFMALTSAY